MSLISVKNLTFFHDGGISPVFENVSFTLDTDWKLGLIGRNGRGKTTFLDLLAGKYEYSGSISANVKFTRFPYEINDADLPVGELLAELCPTAEQWRIARELSLLGMGEDRIYMPFSCLSGGEQTKVMLAGLFLNDGDFPLIDEPTNHLDARSRSIVAEYLKNKRGFILVSHDRRFLDGCVDHIMAINRADIELVSGNFSTWFENFERRQAFEATQNEKLKKDIGRLKEASERSAGWADKTEASKYGKASSGLKQDKGYVGHKSAKLMKSAKVTEARRDRAVAEKSTLLKNAETAERLKLYPLEYRSERLAEFKNTEIFYGGSSVCNPVNFNILRGQRVFLDGKNGCGKSSLLKLLVGEKLSFAGAVEISSGLIISYVPQSSEGLCGRLADFARECGVDVSLFFAILSKMDFYDFDAELSRLSEGQKRKVLIAKSLCERAHLYVWDEPLNYIDIYSRMQIEALISEFKPTMLLVEHDGAFREAVATDSVQITGK